MIKQNVYIENLWVLELTQSRLVAIQMHGQSELDCVSFWKTTCFQGRHFVRVGEDRVVCVGGSVWVC